MTRRDKGGFPLIQAKRETACSTGRELFAKPLRECYTRKKT
ncbi:hypothetical protein CLOSTMETH_03825 [[Clostridium] methylpentosum DSM 5476]|uniref:Uncharacterized protein n=1 Tax=[Clostridium] methylpentosum DSM 5476 TaxID=537013 RepID=C0EIX9_9FIRM|nr:hypothetical protein CLOSTMETH_03825 [[Clostridium] methylpentosum DSM 5476]